MEINIRGYKVLIDDEDWPRIKRHRWIVQQRSGRKVYFQAYINRKKIYLHQFIKPCVPTTDHEDGDSFNNQKENLRPATHAEQQQNISKKGIFRTSQYKGVCLSKKKWVAAITVNRRRIHLGRFTEEIDAAKAYNKAALEHHGKFACINEITNA